MDIGCPSGSQLWVSTRGWGRNWDIHTPHKIAALQCNNEILQKELVALKIAKVALDQGRIGFRLRRLGLLLLDQDRLSPLSLLFILPSPLLLLLFLLLQSLCCALCGTPGGRRQDTAAVADKGHWMTVFSGFTEHVYSLTKEYISPIIKFATQSASKSGQKCFNTWVLDFSK